MFHFPQLLLLKGLYVLSTSVFVIPKILLTPQYLHRISNILFETKEKTSVTKYGKQKATDRMALLQSHPSIRDPEPYHTQCFLYPRVTTQIQYFLSFESCRAAGNFKWPRRVMFREYTERLIASEFSTAPRPFYSKTQNVQQKPGFCLLLVYSLKKQDGEGIPVSNFTTATSYAVAPLCKQWSAVAGSGPSIHTPSVGWRWLNLNPGP